MSGGPRDAVRPAILRLEAGEPVDPVTLRTAATAMLWHAGHLLAESLSESGRSQPVPLGSEGGVALRSPVRRGEQAGDITSGIELAVTYAWLGQADKAAAIAGDARDEGDRRRGTGADRERAVDVALLGPGPTRRTRSRCRATRRQRASRSSTARATAS